MSEINEYLHDNYPDPVAMDLYRLLNTLEALFDEWDGQNEIYEQIEEEGDNGADNHEWVRNKITQSCIIVLEYYGIDVDPDIPLHTMVGIMKPLTVFNEDESRGMWGKVDPSNVDNETLYAMYSRSIYEFNSDPLVYIHNVTDGLVEIFTRPEAMDKITDAVYNRKVLREFLDVYPSDMGKELMQLDIASGLPFGQLVKVLVDVEEADRRAYYETRDHVIDMIALSLTRGHISQNTFKVVSDYFEDAYGQDPIVLDLGMHLQKIKEDYMK